MGKRGGGSFADVTEVGKASPWASGRAPRPSRNPALVVLFLCSLATFVEGLDTATIGYVAPYLREQMHLTPMMLGSVFSASIAGMLVGSLTIGRLGDEFGRRPVIVACAIPFGALTFATAFASTYEQLLALRFASGVALGGIPPLVFALVIESAPSNARGTFTGTIMASYSFGAFVAGLLTAFVAQRAGWSAVFLIAGIATLAEATALAIFLPESPMHRSASGESRAADARWSLAALFRGDLRLVTPLLWLCSGASALALHFKANWTPMIYEALAVDRGTAAFVASLSGLVGAAAGLLLTGVADLRGRIWIAALPVVAVPVLLVAGMADLSQGAFLAVTFLASLLVTSIHFGVLSMIGLSYPTSIRGFAIGCVLGVAKLGGIAGPVIGGYLLSAGLPVRSSYPLLAFGTLIIGVCLLPIVRRDRLLGAMSTQLVET